MSKVMMHLFSRIARLLARVGKLGRYLEEPSSSAISTTLGPESMVHVDTTSTGLLPSNVMPTIMPSPSMTSTGGSSSQTSEAALAAEAANLYDDVSVWDQSLKNASASGATSGEHERVQVGNKAYASAMRILLFRKVYGRSRDDADVQAAAQEVLQHCSVSTAALGMSIDLMWPAVIAGCEVDGGARQWLLTLLEGFKAQCCFDVDTAARIIQEVWHRVDTQDGRRADWKSVCDDLGLKVLLC